MANHTLTTDPRDPVLAFDYEGRLHEMEQALSHLSHFCELVSEVAKCTAASVVRHPVRPDNLASVFGWIGIELHDLRLHVLELDKELCRSKNGGATHD